MTEILLTVIIILLIINIVIALTKKQIVCKPNVWKDCYAKK